MDHRQWLEQHAAERYVLGELAEPERDEFEEHFFSCVECAEEVRAAGRFAANARVVFAEEERKPVVMPRRRFWRPLIAVPWAAALALATVCSYQSFVVIPRLARSAGPQLVPAVTLLPATRGSALSVRARPDAAFIQFQFDVNPTEPFPRYACELRTAAGATVFVREGDAPPPGHPMTLLVPAAALPPGEYVVVVRGVKSPGVTAGPELDRYPIVVEP
jgi:hypothetical protein